MRAADHAEHADIPSGIGFVLRLLPAHDREAIVGDLIEDAAYRGLEGARLRWWLLGQCATIAAGLSISVQLASPWWNAEDRFAAFASRVQ